jgi:predicted TIM-barrel fold metal-dependent hydrolase
MAQASRKRLQQEMTMSLEYANLQDPAMQGAGVPAGREPQKPTGLRLPQGTVVVSADTHWEMDEDVFVNEFPEHLKAFAPRVWMDKFWHIAVDGKVAFGDVDIVSDLPSGLWDLNVRAQHMDTEGVQKEINFPQTIMGFIHHPNLEVREWIYRIYNQYTAKRNARHPGRFNGVAVCSNWWDPGKARESLLRIKEQGFKTYMIPISAGKSLDGKDLSYGGPEMDAFWDAADEVGLPVNFHIGENIKFESRGALGSLTLQHVAPFRKPLGQLIFGGVFDRHPDLKVVFTEGGISWIPTALQDAEMIYDCYDAMLQPALAHRPSYYWHNNCYGTFQNDLLGLKLLEYIGIDRIMWATDYPHAESSFGYTWNSMKSVVDATSPDDARKILGGTALKLYKLS